MSNAWKLDEAGAAALAELDQLAREQIAPRAAEVDREAAFPKDGVAAMRARKLLGLVTEKRYGGLGQGLRTAVAFAERIARDCPSTAMIIMMHYCAAAVLEQHGTEALRRAVGERGALATLAFSEAGSRSHFWVPVSSAEFEGDQVKLNAKKSWVTSAGQADLYVWSSRPASAEGLSSIWAVPGDASGLSIPEPYEGLGLRGNSSSPISADSVTIPGENALGADGAGFDIMMGAVIPYFSLQNGAVSLGLCEGALARTVAHVSGTGYSYDSSGLRDIPQVRGRVARMKLKVDMLRGLLLDCLDAVETGREDATLRVLEAKLAGSETALEVLDEAMRVCGGAAYRKEVGVERYFRDSRAASVMAPVTDALYDFVGKAVCGMAVFG